MSSKSSSSEWPVVVDRTGGIVRITLVNQISFAPTSADDGKAAYADPKLFTIDRRTQLSKLLAHYLENAELAPELRLLPKDVLLVDERGTVLKLGSTVGSICVEHQAKVYIFKKDNSEGQGSSCCATARLCLEVLGPLASAAMVAVVLYLMVRYLVPSGDRYGVIVDAGSTHSSVYVYRWNRSSNGTGGKVDEVFSCELEPLKGISEFADRPEDVKPYFLGSSCFLEAVGKVPSSSRRVSPLVVCGTGGVRALATEEPEKASALLRSAEEAVEGLGFASANGSHVRVLDGIDEGVYGWISANYVLGGFDDVRREVGSLDWGGASSQVTFPCCRSAETTTDEEDVREVAVMNRTRRVFSSSHRCYGQDEALKRYYASLAHERYAASGGREIPPTISSPCHPKGLRPDAKTGSDLLGRCTERKDAAFNRLLANSTVSFVGGSDLEACGRIVDAQFDKSACSEAYLLTRACFDSAKSVRPPPAFPFVAFSTYWYLAEVFGGLLRPSQADAAKDRLKVSREEFEEATRRVCALGGGRGLLNSGWGSDRARNSCFRALFMRKLLVDGYGFSSWENITFANTIGGRSAGWTLGFAVQAASDDLPAPAAATGVLLQVGFVLCLAASLCLLVAVAGASLKSCRRRRGCGGDLDLCS